MSLLPFLSSNINTFLISVYKCIILIKNFIIIFPVHYKRQMKNLDAGEMMITTLKAINLSYEYQEKKEWSSNKNKNSWINIALRWATQTTHANSRKTSWTSQTAWNDFEMNSEKIIPTMSCWYTPWMISRIHQVNS